MSAMAFQTTGVRLFVQPFLKTNIKEKISKNQYLFTLQWRHNERDGVSNHQRLDCLLNRLLRLRVTGICEGNHRWPVDSLHKGLITRKPFRFDDVMMFSSTSVGQIYRVDIGMLYDWICRIYNYVKKKTHLFALHDILW